MKILRINTDGGSRGNPGPSAIGVVIKPEPPHAIVSLSRRIHETTNNVAEYSAVLSALEWLTKNGDAISLPTYDKIEFSLDSTLVVNQLNGLFKMKSPQLRELLIKIRILENLINRSITYKYIPREQNYDADRLVNKAFDDPTF